MKRKGVAIMKKVTITFLSVIAVFAWSVHVFADSWALPEPKKYYSESKQYYIEIVPRKLESQLKYFQDKVDKKDQAGSRPGVTDNYCKGTLYKQTENGKFEKVWESRLSNDVAPVAALVSNSGEYVVTFDNWHSVGYGDDVVVIYGRLGKTIRKMALSDIVSPDTRLPRSVSSIWWGGTHYIDEKKLHLVLKVVSRWNNSFDAEPEYKDIRFDLTNGELVKPTAVAE
jgi:hypothetical protein